MGTDNLEHGKFYCEFPLMLIQAGRCEPAVLFRRSFTLPTCKVNQKSLSLQPLDCGSSNYGWVWRVSRSNVHSGLKWKTLFAKLCNKLSMFFPSSVGPYFYYVMPNETMFTPMADFAYTTNHMLASALEALKPSNALATTRICSEIEVKCKSEDRIDDEVALKQHRVSRKTSKTQNPYRNTCTNLGNQVLGFVSAEKKSCGLLLRLFPELDEVGITRYYEYARKIRRTINGYMNFEKMSRVWNATPKAQDLRLHSMFLQMSHYYMVELSLPSLLTSKKLKKHIIR